MYKIAASVLEKRGVKVLTLSVPDTIEEAAVHLKSLISSVSIPYRKKYNFNMKDIKKKVDRLFSNLQNRQW